MAGILERAGMARGALYHYFPGGKREIFGAVFEHDQRGVPPPPRRAGRSSTRRWRGSGPGSAVFLELCTDDDFARIAWSTPPDSSPARPSAGAPTRCCVGQLDEAAAAGEAATFDVEAMAWRSTARCAAPASS